MGGGEAACLYPATMSLSIFSVSTSYTAPTGAWYGWFDPDYIYNFQGRGLSWTHQPRGYRYRQENIS